MRRKRKKESNEKERKKVIRRKEREGRKCIQGKRWKERKQKKREGERRKRREGASIKQDPVRTELVLRRAGGDCSDSAVDDGGLAVQYRRAGLEEVRKSPFLKTPSGGPEPASGLHLAP